MFCTGQPVETSTPARMMGLSDHRSFIATDGVAVEGLSAAHSRLFGWGRTPSMGFAVAAGNVARGPSFSGEVLDNGECDRPCEVDFDRWPAMG